MKVSKITYLLSSLFILLTVFSSQALALQYARPTSDISLGNWSPIPPSATALYTTVDETTADDTDYMSTSSDDDTAELGLGTISPPGSGTRTLRIRAMSNDRNNNIDIVLLSNGTSAQTFNRVALNQDSFATIELTVTNTISDYSALSVSFDSNTLRGDEARVSWVEFEVPDPAPIPPTVANPTFSAVTDTSATLSAEITSTGSSNVTERGVVWSTSPNPTTASNEGSCSETAGSPYGTGTFSCNATGLTPSTTYYFAGYAINSVGTSYSYDGTFDTNPAVGTAPTVANPTFSAVTGTTVTLGAEITNTGADNVTERGIVWSTSPNPTTASNEGSCSETAPAPYGTGPFSCSVTGLTPSTTYYFAGYATNSTGTSYSEDGTFDTIPPAGTAPTMANPTFSAITDTTATLGAEITSLGTSSVTERGIVWSTSPNPTLTDNIGYSDTPGPFVIGAFTGSVSGLPPGTFIYFAGYATNSTGTSYSIDGIFTTTGSAALIGHNYDVNGGTTLGCNTCHGLHGGSLVPTADEVYTACTQCHNSTGGGAVNSDKWDVANHIVTKQSEEDAGLDPLPTYTIDCGQCHEIHKNSLLSDAAALESGGGLARNIKYIRVNMTKYMPDARTNTVFQNDPGHFAEYEATPLSTELNGVCQSCHTDTKFHQNIETGGASADHKLTGGPPVSTTDCISCHKHGTGVENDNLTGSGFLPSGGHSDNDTVVTTVPDCLACHPSPNSNPVSEIHGDNCIFCHENQSGGLPLVSYLDSGGITAGANCVDCHEFTADNKANTVSGHHTYTTIASSKTANGNAMNGTCIKCHDADVGQTGTNRAAGNLDMPANLACNWCHLWWPNNKSYYTATTDNGYDASGAGGTVNVFQLNWDPNDTTAKTHASSTALSSHAVSKNTTTPISDYAACFSCHGASAATKGSGFQVIPFHGFGPAVTGFEPISGDSGSPNVNIIWYGGPDSSGLDQPKRNDPRHPGFGAFNHLAVNASGTNLVRPVTGTKQFATDSRKAHDLDWDQWIRSTAITTIKSGEFPIPWDNYNSAVGAAPGTSDNLNTGGQNGPFTIDTIIPLVPLSLPTSITP